MKKILIFAAMATALFFVSCNDDKDEQTETITGKPQQEESLLKVKKLKNIIALQNLEAIDSAIVSMGLEAEENFIQNGIKFYVYDDENSVYLIAFYNDISISCSLMEDGGTMEEAFKRYELNNKEAKSYLETNPSVSYASGFVFDDGNDVEYDDESKFMETYNTIDKSTVGMINQIWGTGTYEQVQSMYQKIAAEEESLFINTIGYSDYSSIYAKFLDLREVIVAAQKMLLKRHIAK